MILILILIIKLKVYIQGHKHFKWNECIVTESFFFLQLLAAILFS